MKAKKIEELKYRVAYVAPDGSEFDTQEECLKYEKSALGVLRSRLKAIEVFRGSEEDLFTICGSCDDDVSVFVPRTVDDIYLLRQMILLGGRSEEYAERLGEDQVGKPVIFDFGYDGSYFSFMTLDDFVSVATDGRFTVTEVKDRKLSDILREK